MTQTVRLKTLSPTLRASVYDAIFFFMMFGAGESYLGAYGVFLGLSHFQIGLLTTFPLFIGALSQLLGVHLMELRLRRRSIIVSGVLMQSVSWLLIAFTPWLFETPVARGWALMLAATMYSTFGQFVVPGWISLMGDLVPEKIRGEFFGYRNKLCAYFLLFSFVGAGYTLKLAEENGVERMAFTGIFLFALIARLISSYFLTKHEDPDYTIAPHDKFSFWKFLRKAKHSNFTRFTLFHGTYNMALMIAGPYFIIYMLRELQLSYWEYTLVAATWIATNFYMMQFWGKFADTFGNKKVLELCAVGLCFIPFLWTLGTSLTYLLALQFIAGAFTSGLQLSAMNFLLDAVSPGKRGRCTAYLWVINASCVITGSLAGSAILAAYENSAITMLALYESPYLNLFLVSTVARVLVCMLLLPRFREVRNVPNWNYKDRFFRFGRIQPFVTPGIQIAVGIYRNRKTRKKDTQGVPAPGSTAD